MLKKIIAILLLTALLAFLALWLFVPEKVSVSSHYKAPVNAEPVYRKLSSDWVSWWPGTVEGSPKLSQILTLNGFRFKLLAPIYSGFKFSVNKNDRTDTLLLQLLSTHRDSLTLYWSVAFPQNKSLFGKFAQYRHAQALKSTIAELSDSLIRYISQPVNLYGIDVQKEQVTIGFLVSTQKEFSSEPSTADCYSLIHHIKDYINQNHGVEDGSPMLHVLKADSGKYKVQAAIPIKEKMVETDSFAVKAMFKGGNILTAKVVGGPATVAYGLKQMDQYVADYQKTVMAIPFQMLITDRTQVTDTTKWITELYCPIQK